MLNLYEYNLIQKKKKMYWHIHSPKKDLSNITTCHWAVFTTINWVKVEQVLAGVIEYNREIVSILMDTHLLNGVCFFGGIFTGKSMSLWLSKISLNGEK